MIPGVGGGSRERGDGCGVGAQVSGSRKLWSEHEAKNGHSLQSVSLPSIHAPAAELQPQVPIQAQGSKMEAQLTLALGRRAGFGEVFKIELVDWDNGEPETGETAESGKAEVAEVITAGRGGPGREAGNGDPKRGLGIEAGKFQPAGADGKAVASGRDPTRGGPGIETGKLQLTETEGEGKAGGSSEG